MTIHDLPAVNASLNALSTVFLASGYAFIRARRIAQHRACMLAALTTSAFFLVSYIVYHAQVGSVRFTREGMVRTVYFTILITHVTLARRAASRAHPRRTRVEGQLSAARRIAWCRF